MPEETQDVITWMQEYQKTQSVELRNRLVMHYSYIPKVVAAKMRSATASYQQLEDIVSQGMLTLIDCVEKYRDDKGTKFETYAFMRIKCANIDYIRKQDWLPRRVRKTARDITAAYEALANKLMREPTSHELAQEMGVSEEVLEKHFCEMSNSMMLSFENLLEGALPDQDSEDYASDDIHGLPEHRVLRHEQREQLMGAIDCLNERERLIISLYYKENLRLCEIAKVLEVSESRVSQMHSKALLKLRQSLLEYEKG